MPYKLQASASVIYERKTQIDPDTETYQECPPVIKNSKIKTIKTKSNLNKFANNTFMEINEGITNHVKGGRAAIAFDPSFVIKIIIK